MKLHRTLGTAEGPALNRVNWNIKISAGHKIMELEVERVVNFPNNFGVISNLVGFGCGQKSTFGGGWTKHMIFLDGHLKAAY